MKSGDVSETAALSLSVQDVFVIGTIIIIVSLPLILLLREPKKAASA
ncbi:hypothetical protein MHI37_01575 [Paenibacillus sp. FSL H8-0548]|nr:hypothetical protein [Paenibacillus sp. FSL H8-0548]